MTAMPAVVFATPAAMAEHGAAVRTAAAAVRRFFVAATAAAGVRRSIGARRHRSGHEEMSRRRLVDQTLERTRLGAYAEVALGGPQPR